MKNEWTHKDGNTVIKNKQIIRQGTVTKKNRQRIKKPVVKYEYEYVDNYVNETVFYVDHATEKITQTTTVAPVPVSDSQNRFDLTCGPEKMNVVLINTNPSIQQDNQVDQYPRIKRDVSERQIIIRNQGASENLGNFRSLFGNECDDQTHQFEFNNEKTIIEVSLDDDCFIKKSSDDDYLFYSFDFYLPPEAYFYGNNQKDQHVVTDWGSTWSATCKYDRLKQVTVEDPGTGQIAPAIDWSPYQELAVNDDMIEAAEVADFGEFGVEMQIYKSESYSFLAEEPYHYNMNERIYAQVNFREGEFTEDLSLMIEKCWASPEPDTGDSSSSSNSFSKFQLFSDSQENGCTMSSLVKLENNGLRYGTEEYHSDRFSARVFKWPDQQLKVYINCQVLICQKKHQCTHTCGRSTRLSRYGSSDAENGKTIERLVTFGPYEVYDPSLYQEIQEPSSFAEEIEEFIDDEIEEFVGDAEEFVYENEDAFLKLATEGEEQVESVSESIGDFFYWLFGIFSVTTIVGLAVLNKIGIRAVPEEKLGLTDF